MKTYHRYVSFFLCLILCLSICSPVLTASSEKRAATHTVTYLREDGSTAAVYTVRDGARLPEAPILCDGFDCTGNGAPDVLPLTVTSDLTLTSVATKRDLTRETFSLSDVAGQGTFQPLFGTLTENGFLLQGVLSSNADGTFSSDLTGATVAGNGDITLPGANGGACVALRYTAPRTGYLSIGFSALCAERAPAHQKSTQATKTVGGKTYYGYYSKRNPDAVYYSTASGVARVEKSNCYLFRESTGTMARLTSALPKDLTTAILRAPIACSVTICQNGKPIWPQDSSPLSYVGETVYPETNDAAAEDLRASLSASAPLPESLYVREGDTLIFAVRQDNSTTNRMTLLPAISYREVLPDVTFSASIGIYDRFSLSFYLPSVGHESEAGILLGNRRLTGALQEDGIYRMTLSGISAKELTDDVTVTPYHVLHGEIRQGEPCTVSPADLLDRYASDPQFSDSVRTLASATLQYAAAAQLYFSYRTDDLAAGIATGDVARTHAEYPGHFSLTADPESPVSFYGATLVLEDSVIIKVLLSAATDFTGYTVTVRGEDGREQALTIETDTQAGIGSVSLSGILPKKWNIAYTFTVRDAAGAAHGTLTYSVTSYAAHLQQKDGTPASLSHLLDTMLVLYESALSYRNATQSA